MKKTKLLAFLMPMLALTMAGCGETEPEKQVMYDKTYHWTVDAEGNVEADSKIKHDYEEVAEKAVAATCSEKGKKVEKCKVCGYEKESDVPKANHTYVEDTTKAVAATCATDGKKVEVCSVCSDKKETPIAATGHTLTTTPTAKTGVSTIACNKNDYTGFEFDIAQATGWNKATTKWNAKTTDPSNNAVEASWDVTGVIPDGKYSIELEGLMSYTSHGDRYFYNQWETDSGTNADKESESPYRYFFKLNGETVVNPSTTKSWSELGYEGSNNSGTPKFATVVSEVNISGLTTFSAFHGDIGYSMIVSRIRLVKIA